jgi:excisionase family DNA binding protein
MPKEIMGNTVYTLKEAAQIFGVTIRTMHNYIKDKRITGQKIGGIWYFTEETLQAFVRGPQSHDAGGNIR